MRTAKLVFILSIALIAEAQIKDFPFIENFDNVAAPSLPPGWSTTTNRNTSGDFTTTKSAPYSDSNAVFSTNAKIQQSLISPSLDFSGKEGDGIEFFERRSGTHNSGILLEASVDGGGTFPILLGDTLQNPGTTSYVLRKLKIPPSVSGKPDVKIRWRIIGNGTGSSGTVRFDDISVSALFHNDAAVDSVSFIPLLPVTGDSVSIIATIRNSGLLPVQDVTVGFFKDTNGNLTPEPEELSGTESIDRIIQPACTARVISSAGIVTFGDQSIIVRINYSGDQNRANDIKQIYLSVGLPPRSVVLNEIMYAPKSPEPEWIEIYNTHTDSIDLKNWEISNRNRAAKHVLSAESAFLRPLEFCVITKEIAHFTAVHPDIPTAIIQIPSLPTYFMNNSGDALFLTDRRGAVIDSVRYSPEWGGSDNSSLERIEYSDESDNPSNWGSSADSAGSTPGKQNSLTPLESDLRILNVSPLCVPPDNGLDIAVSIFNAGRLPAETFSVSLYYNADGESACRPPELIETRESCATLFPGETFHLNFRWNNPPPGYIILIAHLIFLDDMRISDNIFYRRAAISFPPGALIVNEIMFEPLPGDAEYVELHNAGSSPVDIVGWRLSDTRDTLKKHILSESTLVLAGGDYLVVSFDTSVFMRFSYLAGPEHSVAVRENMLSLNNDGDDIILTDLLGRIIDSIHYIPSWHNPDVGDAAGRSLERINPKIQGNDRRNWSTSAHPLGGTPGKENSLFTNAPAADAEIVFSPNPFSPDGDGYEDVTILCYQLPHLSALLRIRIYDVKGRLVRTLADREPGASHGEIVWDGYNDSRERVRIGIYIVLLESLDGFGGNLRALKGTVVVAAKM